LRDLCTLALQYEVAIGLEFLPWTPLNTVGKALEIVEGVNTPNAGIVFDTFHFCKGIPSFEELIRVPFDRIAIVRTLMMPRMWMWTL